MVGAGQPAIPRRGGSPPRAAELGPGNEGCELERALGVKRLAAAAA
jgi:hypothetical protein